MCPYPTCARVPHVLVSHQLVLVLRCDNGRLHGVVNDSAKEAIGNLFVARLVATRDRSSDGRGEGGETVCALLVGWGAGACRALLAVACRLPVCHTRTHTHTVFLVFAA